MNRVLSIAVLTLALATLPACIEPDTSDEDADIRLLDQRKQEILDFVGTPACDEPGHCRYIPLGEKPCGGPWSYLIYSTANVDSAALAAMVTAYNEFNGLLNERYGWASDCSVPIPPVLDCVDGVCVDVGGERAP